jgi:hypothetical protein
MRPASIVNFDRLYLVGIVLGLVNSLMSVGQLQARISADPALRSLGSGQGLIFGLIALSLAIPLLLWFLIAHRRSMIAKWLLVAYTALAIINLLPTLRHLGMGGGLGILANLAIEALRVVALSFLFRPDAKAWLGGGGSAGDAQD